MAIETLFLTIFDLRSSIVLTFSIAATEPLRSSRVIDLLVVELHRMASDYPIHLKEFSGAILFDACDVEVIQKMEIRDDDTWVLSFPRSGNFTIQRNSCAQPTALNKA